MVFLSGILGFLLYRYITMHGSENTVFFDGFILDTDRYYGPYERTVCVAFLVVQIVLRSNVY